MAYLFLNDPNKCPACNRKGVKHFRPCEQCGVMLFAHEIRFQDWERETNAVMHWWLFTNAHGWKHRSHVMPKEAPEALTRDLPETKL